MKKNVLALFLGVFTLVSSCSGDSSTNGKIKETVKAYLDNAAKKESISEYKIDSIIVKNITEKQKLEGEAFRYRDLALRKLEEVKENANEYQRKRDLHDLMLELSTSEDAFIKSNQNDLDRMKSEFESQQSEILGYSAKATEMANKSFKADSVKVLYYDVEAIVTTTSDNKVQKDLMFRFHISKDYKIIKEPLDFIDEELE